MRGPWLLASAEVDLLKPGQGAFQKTSQLVFADVLLIVGAGVILMALLVLWALYLRKKRRHRRHHKHHHHRSSQAAARDSEPVEESVETEPEEEMDGESARPHRHHRRRVRRRSHRGRNPTLAETGGLPPMRPAPTSTPIPPPEVS